MRSISELQFLMTWLLATLATLSAGAAIGTTSSPANSSISLSSDSSIDVPLPDKMLEGDAIDFEGLPTNLRVKCDPISFSEDKTTSDSPLAEDCLRLAFRAANGGDDWSFSGYGKTWREVMAVESCAMGASAKGLLIPFKAHVGDQDFINAIKHSIHYYSHVYLPDGRRRVQGRGTFMCSVNFPGQQTRVTWEIYSSSIRHRNDK